jgi:hypothetical protein
MRTIAFGVLATLGFLSACQTEQEEVRRAAEDVQKEAQEARQEIGREIEEGREEVGEARENMAEKLRQAERSGEPVEFDAVVVGSDPDTLNLKLASGETFDVDYVPNIQATRGTETLNLRELPAGTTVHVTYHYADGKRVVEQVIVNEPGAAPEGQPPATPAGTPPEGTMPGATTPDGSQPGSGTR